MSKFTSGEWHIERNVHDAYSDVEHELVVPEDWCIGKDYIAAVIDPTDAKLITAAPEMYDELYEALQLLQGKSSYDGDEFSQQAESIRELLARIDGEEAEHA